MSDEFDIVYKTDQSDDLDNPLRAVIVVNTKDAPEGDMEERMLDGVQTFDEVNAFFDLFDEKIAYPNEAHIKYEVGSDGLVVFIVDSLEVKAKVIKFLDAYVTDSQTKDANASGDEEAGEAGGLKKKLKQ